MYMDKMAGVREVVLDQVEAGRTGRHMGPIFQQGPSHQPRLLPKKERNIYLM
jgi:hypothetical protein